MLTVFYACSPRRHHSAHSRTDRSFTPAHPDDTTAHTPARIAADTPLNGSRSRQPSMLRTHTRTPASHHCPEGLMRYMLRLTARCMPWPMLIPSPIHAARERQQSSGGASKNSKCPQPI